MPRAKEKKTQITSSRTRLRHRARVSLPLRPLAYSGPCPAARTRSALRAVHIKGGLSSAHRVLSKGPDAGSVATPPPPQERESYWQLLSVAPAHCIPIFPTSDRHLPGLCPQVSLASLDSEAPLTLGLNLSRLGGAEHILELRPALESLGGRVRYVIARGNGPGFFRVHHLRGLSSLQLGRRRPGPGTYQLELVSVARPWGTWPERKLTPGGGALRLKVQLRLL